MSYPYVVNAQGAEISFTHMLEEIAQRRAAGEMVVATNGCFDLLHSGHIASLQQARALGDLLVVGLNSDASVARLKGPGKPLVEERDRAYLLSALRCVDYVVVFEEIDANGWLEPLRPHRYCKSGDYTIDSLPETDIVQRGGGEVCILPFQKGFSTSTLISRIMLGSQERPHASTQGRSVLERLLENSNILRQSAYLLADRVQSAADRILEAVRRGGKVLVCGNGGSAAVAQQFAADMVAAAPAGAAGWPVIALTADGVTMTNISNNQGFEQVFASQVHAVGQEGDLLMVLCARGYAPNIIAAIRAARQRGMITLGLVGEGASPVAELCDHVLAVPSSSPAMVLQAHLAISLLVGELVSEQLCLQS